ADTWRGSGTGGVGGRLEVLAGGTEGSRPEEKQPRSSGRGEPPDAFGHVGGVEQLVPVPAAPKDKDESAEPDPFKDDGEGSRALGADKGLGPYDGYLKPPSPVFVRHPFRVRSGCR